MARFNNGWVKLWRISLEKDLSQNVYLWSIWHALLHMAVWKETQIIWNGKQRILKPGAVVFGISEISERWGCSQRTISKWLHYLHDTGRIVLESCSRGTIATICNWEIYQGTEDYVFAPSADQVGTKYEQSKNQVGLIEEGKKERKKEQKIYSSKFDLEAAYQRYPLKEGKSPGLKRLEPQIKTQEDYDALLVAIDRYSKSEKVQKGFIKNFKTFAGEWRDWTLSETGTSVAGSDEPFDIGKLLNKSGAA